MTPPARPLRILHLLGHEPDYQTERAVQALSRGGSLNVVPELHRIGRGGRWRHLPAAAWGLRSAARDFDLVHCWDEPALTAAATAGARRVVYSPQRFPDRRGVGWLRAVMGYRDVQVVCPTATLRRHLAERGVPLDRVHLVRPGVDFSLVNRRRDAGLRAALGIAAGDYVLLAPGESTAAADHRLAVWTGSILGVLDPAVRVLLLGRGPQARAAIVLAGKLGQPGLVRPADARLGRRVAVEELLPAADAVLVTATGPAATLPVAACMAAALPIVSTVTPTLAELLEDRHTALMVYRPRPRLLAERVLALREDAKLQWQIADTARAEAYEFLSLTRFLAAWRDVYRQVAGGGRVELAEHAVT